MIDSPVDTTVCMNIGRGQRRVRYWSAMGFAALSVVLLAYLTLMHLNRWLRLILFPIMYVGFSSYLEASRKTCIQLANRNEQSLDDGVILTKVLKGDKITDTALSARLRQQARAITIDAALFAFVALTLLMMIPQ